MTMTEDLAAITAAIDSGDTDPLTLMAWADALEEMGDARAAGLRKALAMGKCPLPPSGPLWCWCCATPYIESGHMVDRAAYRLLTPERPGFAGIYDDTCYPTRSAAFLALAEALAPRPGGGRGGKVRDHFAHIDGLRELVAAEATADGTVVMRDGPSQTRRVQIRKRDVWTYRAIDLAIEFIPEETAQ